MPPIQILVLHCACQYRRLKSGRVRSEVQPQGGAPLHALGGSTPCRSAKSGRIGESLVSRHGTSHALCNSRHADRPTRCYGICRGARLAGARAAGRDLASRAGHEFNDSHFHLTNYIQKGITPRAFLKIMGNRVGRSALFGIPLQQQWSYR